MKKKKHQTFSFSLFVLAFWFFFVLFFHVVCKVSFNRWTVKHLAQASLTELTFLEKCRILFCCTSWISVPNELFPIQYVTSPSRETSEFCIQLKYNWSATKKNQRFSTPKKSKHQGAVSESKHYLPWQKAFRILHSIKWPTRSGFLEHAIKIRPRFTLYCPSLCFC